MNIANHSSRSASCNLLQVETSTGTHLTVKGNLEHVEQSTTLMDGILTIRRKLSSAKKSIRSSRQSLERAKSRDKFPSLNVTQTGSKHARHFNAPPCGQRSAEWNEEREEFARHKGIQTSQRALQDKRTLQRCSQNKLLEDLRPYHGEEYHDRHGDTFQRQEVPSRQ